MEIIRIGRAAAAAVESRETVPALILCIDVAEFEFIADTFVSHTCIDIAEKEFFLADKLVAGIEITPRSHS